MSKVKLKIDHRFEVPEDMTEIARYGGYGIGLNSDGIYVCGTTQFNLTTSKIYEARVIPLKRSLISKEVRDVANDVEGTIENLFEFDEEQVYFHVFYGSPDEEVTKSYIFSDLNEALGLVGLFANYKAEALKDI